MPCGGDYPPLHSHHELFLFSLQCYLTVTVSQSCLNEDNIVHSVYCIVMGMVKLCWPSLWQARVRRRFRTIVDEKYLNEISYASLTLGFY